MFHRNLGHTELNTPSPNPRSLFINLPQIVTTPPITPQHNFISSHTHNDKFQIRGLSCSGNNESARKLFILIY